MPERNPKIIETTAKIPLTSVTANIVGKKREPRTNLDRALGHKNKIFPQPIKEEILSDSDSELQQSQEEIGTEVETVETELIDVTTTQPTENQEIHNPITVTEAQQAENMSIDATEIIDKINKCVPEFRGADGNDIPSALTRFIALAEWVRSTLKTDDDRKVFDFWIRYRLVDDAFRKTQNADVSTFKKLKDTLEGIYFHIEILEEVRLKCFSCQQREIESTEQYGQRLAYLFEEYTGCFERKYGTKLDVSSKKELAEQAMNTFKIGLKNVNLRVQIAATRMNTLSELIKEAVIVEKLINDYGNSTYERKETAEYSKQLVQPRCGYCNRKNHTYEECRTRMKQQQQQSNYRDQNGRANRTRYTKSCSHCRIMGHDITECRTKMRMQNQNQNDNPESYTVQQNTWSPRNNVNSGPRTSYPVQNTNNRPQPYNQQTNTNLKPGEPIICRYCKKPGHIERNCNNKSRMQQNPNELSDKFNNLRICYVNQEESQHEQMPKANITEYPENFQGSDEQY